MASSGPRHPLEDTHWPTAEAYAASWLARPLRLASGLLLRDRTWVPAMVPWRASDEGFVTPAVLDWYGRFAAGRPGTLVVEATGIRDVPSGPLLRIGHERFLPGLRALVERVAQESGGETRLLIQLLDFLRIRRRPERDRYLREFLVITPRIREGLATLGSDPTAQEAALREALVRLDDRTLATLLGPRETEALERGARERVTDTHEEHIAALPAVLPALFATAACRARDAGFDGVELHYAHAYTMASFLSRLNDRADGYGRTLEGRLRLPLEVYRQVRAAVGADFTLGCRFLVDEVIAGGSTVEDAEFFGPRFADAGLDFISLSRGGKFEDARQPRVGEAAYPYTGESGHACMPTVFGALPPFGLNLGLMARVRRAVRASGRTTPIVASGGISTFARAERALVEGEADLIGAARQSLADPDWFEKLRTGRGASIQRCRYTNYCEALDQRHLEVTCQLWDRLPATPGEPRSRDGRRRLLAPRGDWSAARPAGQAPSAS